MPDPYNPQDLNRFSYVRNNPIRYTDPTGHMCSDPEDPSPSCDGSGTPPPVTTPPPEPAPVVIINPDPLDDGQEQDDPTPSPIPIPDVNPPSPVTTCASCILYGAGVIVATGLLELVFGAAGVAAVIFSGPGAIPALAILIPVEAMLVNIQLVGIEMIIQGNTRPREDISLDYFPLIHFITDPNEGDYFK